MNDHIKPGDIITLDIRRLGINGEGIGYHNKMAVFVDNALPRERIEAEITAVYHNRAVADVRKIISVNPARQEPFCPVYGICGGCQTQHFDYIRTLIQKREILVQSFERYIYPKVNPSLVKPTIGAKNPTHYRNKASLPVQKIDGRNRFGMYARNSNDFVPIDDCPVQDPAINVILKTIVSLMDEFGIDAYDYKTKHGFVKSVIVRHSVATDQTQVSFIMVRKARRLIELVERLVKAHPSVISVSDAHKPDDKNATWTPRQMRHIHGEKTIQAVLDGMTFHLRPEAFFQLNSPQAEVFYRTMTRLADLKPNENAVDAYAGVAPVSHYVAGHANLVFAIELDQAACDSAKQSLETNGIRNVHVIQGDFHKSLSNLKRYHIDVMLFDPPRTGLGIDTIRTILKMAPERIVYGSCNPSTLAKDLNELLTDYDLVETVPIDMFPYTSLVESVSLLVHKR
jgi:23S rRNA (uracil1939-C5)-methyltransferase